MERAIYRIIDANFNRAREALRVIEEYCRFALNSAALTERAKGLRHELSAAISKLDAGRLLSSRDTFGDVGSPSFVDRGSGIVVGDSIHDSRFTIHGAFTAACKRLTEALRTLTEMTSAAGGQNRAVAKTIEKLRFDAYALEKDIVLVSYPAEKFRRVELYVIISNNLPIDIICLTGACVAGGADCIQLRAKDITDDGLFAVAVEFVKVCKAAGVLSIIHDRVDVAVASGADGVHLGQNDLPVEQARKLQMTPLIIGKSTHSLKELEKACKELPAYVSLGPVFASPTKPEIAVAGLEYIRTAREKLADTGISNVAIGGITLDNVGEVLRAGAAAIAVCSAVTDVADPTAACRALKNKITAFKKENF